MKKVSDVIIHKLVYEYTDFDMLELHRRKMEESGWMSEDNGLEVVYWKEEELESDVVN
jgi:hypothetical protein